MSSPAERLLQDLSLLLELCLVGGEPGDLDAFATSFIDRATSKIGAANGLIFVRTDLFAGDPGSPLARPTHPRFYAFPKRRAQYIIRSGDLDGSEFGIVKTIERGRISLVPGVESVGHKASFEGLEPPALALRMPIGDVALLELYATEADALDERTGRVLSSLTDWLAGQIRGYAAETRLRTRALATEESRRSYEDILSRLPGVVWRADRHGRLTYLSDRASDLLGSSGANIEVHGDLRFPGMEEEDRARVERELAEAIASKRSELVLRYAAKAPDGGVIDREERIAFAYEPGGRLLDLSGIITETRPAIDLRREVELGEQRARAARAEALRLEAERASRAKTEFLDLLSHELRTPLFPIIALSDLLLRTEADAFRPEEWREHVRMINGAGKQMLQLVSDLLDVSRLEGGRARPDPGPVALAHFASSIAEKHSDRARALDSVLEVVVPNASPSGDVYTDRTVLGRIASSLIEHALESAPGARIVLSIESGPSRVAVELRIEGHPLTPEAAARIFDPFWERPEQKRTRTKGTGLRLALVQRLTNAFGGAVRAFPSENRTVVRAELPCAYAPQEAQSTHGRSQRSRAAQKGTRVVVGSAELGRVFATALEVLALGADVRIAHSANELSDLIAKLSPDIVMIDAALPGLAVLGNALAERPGNKRRPRVISLAYDGDERPSWPPPDDTLPLPVPRERLAALLGHQEEDR